MVEDLIHYSKKELLTDYLSYQLEIVYQLKWLINQYNTKAKDRAHYLHILSSVLLLFLGFQYILFTIYLTCVLYHPVLFGLLSYVIYVHNSFTVMHDMRQLRLKVYHVKIPKLHALTFLINVVVFVLYMHPCFFGYVIGRKFLVLVVYKSFFFITVIFVSRIRAISFIIVLIYVVLPIYRVASAVNIQSAILLGFLLALHSGVTIYASSRYQYVMENLMIAKKNIENDLNVRSNVLCFISHECRTPLHYILSTLEMLKNDSNFSTENKESLSSIYDMGKILLEHFNGLLFLAKAERKEIVIEPSHFCLRAVLENVLQMVRSQAFDFNCTVDLNISQVLEELEYIITDKARLRQILLNIVGNRIKSTPNGKVSLFVDLCHDVHTPPLLEDLICIHEPIDAPMTFKFHNLGFTHHEKKYQGLLFTISDDGEGIDSLFMGSILNSRNTIKPDYNTNIKMGLGLTICMRLTEIMHGGIWLSKKYSKGTTFFLTIPAFKSDLNGSNIPLNEVVQPSSLPKEQFRFSSALFCDDDVLFRKIQRKQLHKLGFITLYECKHSKEAVEKYISLVRNDKAPAFVFLDMHTSSLPGTDAAKLIRAWAEKEKIVQPYIIIISGDDLIQYSSLTYLDGILLKPFNMEALQTCVSKVCSRSHENTNNMVQ